MDGSDFDSTKLERKKKSSGLYTCVSPKATMSEI